MFNIPIYRAKKIDSEDFVEGYLGSYKSYKNSYKYIFDEANVDNKYIIDPSTLAISMDGKNWFAMDALEASLKLASLIEPSKDYRLMPKPSYTEFPSKLVIGDILGMKLNDDDSIAFFKNGIQQ